MKTERQHSLLPSFIVGCLLLLSGAIQAAEIPQNGSAEHIGVAGCTASLCHGSLRPKDAYTVLQNEYQVWVDHDRHSGAWETLKSAESKRIARNLGIGNAQKAKICLDCHTDNVPKSKQGRQFQISDGVGCEACHGGAENWISSHVRKSRKHLDNVADGLYPTADPETRVELCLSCHMGTKDKFTTHRIMGAGHPRLVFEVETFTAIQPAHYQLDADYYERKPVSTPLETWAYGQMAAAKHYLSLLDSPLFKQHGLFPELSFFDCQACHHSLEQRRWESRPTLGDMGPGTVHLADAHLLFAEIIAKGIDQGLAKQLTTQIAALNLGTTESEAAVRTAAKQLQATLKALKQRLNKTQIDAALGQRWLDALLDQGQNGRLNDFAAAEQVAMAIPLLAGRNAHRYQRELDAIYKQLESDDRFNPTNYKRRLERLKALDR